LSLRLKAQASSFEEFASGGAQCHAKLHDGSTYSGILLTTATAVIAMRGQAALPFSIEAIDCLFQTSEDINPTTRNGWEFFDDWVS